MTWDIEEVVSILSLQQTILIEMLSEQHLLNKEEFYKRCQDKIDETQKEFDNKIMEPLKQALMKNCGKSKK